MIIGGDRSVTDWVVRYWEADIDWPSRDTQSRGRDALFQISAGRREYHARSVGRD